MDMRTPEVTDATTLRAVASQVRLDIYEALTGDGPATATQLAARFGHQTASMSYHLRTLAKYGFVVEAPELAADRRERVWRAVPGGVRWSRLDSSPGQAEAMQTAERVMLGRQVARLQSWMGQRDQWPPEWTDASADVDKLLHLTAPQTAQMAAEVMEVLDKWSNRGHLRADATAPEAPAADARTVMVLFHAFPL